jgi:hypothetical protein
VPVLASAASVEVLVGLVVSWCATAGLLCSARRNAAGAPPCGEALTLGHALLGMTHERFKQFAAEHGTASAECAQPAAVFPRRVDPD